MDGLCLRSYENKWEEYLARARALPSYSCKPWNSLMVWITSLREAQINNFSSSLSHSRAELPKQETEVANTKTQKECHVARICVQDVDDVTGVSQWRASGFSNVPEFVALDASPLFLCLLLPLSRHGCSYRRPPPGPVHHQGERHQCEQGEPCQRHRSCYSVQEVPETHPGEG